MISSLLLLAEATGAAAPHSDESANGVTKILTDFGIQGPQLLAQAINFAVVAFLLWKFAFKPILATITDRQQKIDSGLKYAEEMKVKLDAAEQTYTDRLKDAQHKAQQIVADALKAAKDLTDKQQREANEKAAALLAKTQESIEREKKKMLAEARSEIARLVVATTQRVLSKELSEFERSKFNEAAARDLTKV